MIPAMDVCRETFTVIVVSIGKVHETKRALELPLEKLNFG